MASREALSECYVEFQQLIHGYSKATPAPSLFLKNIAAKTVVTLIPSKVSTRKSHNLKKPSKILNADDFALEKLSYLDANQRQNWNLDRTFFFCVIQSTRQLRMGITKIETDQAMAGLMQHHSSIIWDNVW